MRKSALAANQVRHAQEAASRRRGQRSVRRAAMQGIREPGVEHQTLGKPILVAGTERADQRLCLTTKGRQSDLTEPVEEALHACRAPEQRIEVGPKRARAVRLLKLGGPLRNVQVRDRDPLDRVGNSEIISTTTAGARKA